MSGACAMVCRTSTYTNWDEGQMRMIRTNSTPTPTAPQGADRHEST
jgi:hypothetical protein